jgi:hypothetical protein
MVPRDIPLGSVNTIVRKVNEFRMILPVYRSRREAVLLITMTTEFKE